MGLLCQSHQSSTLSIFPLTDTVTLGICKPVLTVISLGWIVWVMAMDTSQQPALSFQKAQHRVKRLTKVIILSIMYSLFNYFWFALFLLKNLSVMDLPLYSIFWDWLILSTPNIRVENRTGWQQKKKKKKFPWSFFWDGWGQHHLKIFKRADIVPKPQRFSLSIIQKNLVNLWGILVVCLFVCFLFTFSYFLSQTSTEGPGVAEKRLKSI